MFDSKGYKAEFGSEIAADDISLTPVNEGIPDGYKYSSNDAPMIVSSDAENNIINVYFVKDDFGYTVKYWADGKVFDSKGYKAEFGSEITADDISLTPVNEDIPDGYKYSSNDAPMIVSSDAENNIINVYFVKDEFGYTVKYWADGEVFDSKGYKAEFGSEITADDISLTPVNEDIPDGYKYSSNDAPMTITSNPANNIVNVYYVKDDFGYTVK